MKDVRPGQVLMDVHGCWWMRILSGDELMYVSLDSGIISTQEEAFRGDKVFTSTSDLTLGAMLNGAYGINVFDMEYPEYEK